MSDYRGITSLSDISKEKVLVLQLSDQQSCGAPKSPGIFVCSKECTRDLFSPHYNLFVDDLLDRLSDSGYVVSIDGVFL